MLKHLSWECPGLHGPDTRQDISIVSFEELFARESVIIPLFQRRYCWNRRIAQLWWDDAVNGGLVDTPGRGHGVGRAIFRRCDDDATKTICIDGQQRVTTTLLLCAAIRDAAQALDNLVGDDDARRQSDLVQQLNQVLFSDVSAYHRFVHEHATAIDVSDDRSTVPTSAHPRGELFPCSRLTPSFEDRSCFYHALTAVPIALERARCHAPNADNDSYDYDHTDSSHQTMVKSLFDEAIRKDFESLPASPRVRLRALQRYANCALRGMLLTYVSIENTINFGMVFLWLQEKSLMGQGTFLHNRAPGLKFHAADLVRNLLLAPFLTSTHSQSLVDHEDMYRREWLMQIEQSHSPAQLDRLIGALLDSLNYGKDRELRWERHRSEFEKSVEKAMQMIKRVKPGEDLEGVELYSRFVSWYESLLPREHTPSDVSTAASSALCALQRLAVDFPW